MRVISAKPGSNNLYVFGDNGSGKTRLIKFLFDYSGNYIEESTRMITTSDWVIEDEGVTISLNVKEASNIGNKMVESMLRREMDNSVIVVIIGSSSLGDWLNTLSPFLTPDTVVIAFFSDKRNINPLRKILLKKKYPFVRYWLNMPILNNAENHQAKEVRYLFKQIIINRFSQKLDKVRSLIAENKKNKSKSLDLGKSNLTSLLEIKELFENVHLEELIVSNEWGEYTNGEWCRFESSNNSGPNILFDLPKELKVLINLKVLICGGDWNSINKQYINVGKWHIEDISVLSNLFNLTILNVSNNDIFHVGRLNRLTKLKKLYLNNNRIYKMPPLAKAERLSELYLSNNRLSDVRFLEEMNYAKTIDIHSNNIKDLSPIKNLIKRLGIKESKWEQKAISVANNPLDIPAPSAIRKGKRFVLAYFRKLEAEHEIDLKPFINNDIKLIVVGNSNVGKSTLASWLINEKVDKKISTTHWLDVKTWSAKEHDKTYKVRIFDFGGQEYYHDTHHLFFTNRTGYIVLWEQDPNLFAEIEIDQRRNDNSVVTVKIQTFPLEYWLDSINFHTRRRQKTKSEKEIERLLNRRDESINTSIQLGEEWTKHIVNLQGTIATDDKVEENILIVQNKVDYQREKKFLNETLLKEYHPKILDFLAISVFNNKGVNNLKSKLFEMFESLDIVKQENLGTWGYVKGKIEADHFSTSYSLSDLKNYCNRNIKEMPEVAGKAATQIQKVLFNDNDVEVFAEYLADIGLALYYPENHHLKNKVFLNQNRIIENIHYILLDLEKEKGEFHKDKISKALNDADDQEVNDLIDLMIHFKIIFRHPSKSDSFIAPLYLPKEPVQSVKLFSNLFSKPIYRYRYRSFIHKNVILDFFHHYGYKVLKEDNHSSLFYYWREGIIVKDELSGEIVLITFIPGTSLNHCAHIDVLVIKGSNNDRFLNQIIEDLDKINEGWGVEKLVSSNGEDFIPLSLIHKNEEEDNWVFLYEKKDFKLADFKKHLKKPIKMKRIFISYSKQDLALVNKFVEHLSALQLDGKVAHWYCSELTAGSEWDSEIQHNFNQADIVCFMVSPSFMKTKYIHEHEIAKAFDKRSKDPKFKIVPIILDFCRWVTSKNNLADFTALPYTAKPVMDFNNQNMAWYIIEECLRTMIDKDLDPKGDNFYSNQHLPQDILKIYTRIVEGKVDRNS